MYKIDIRKKYTGEDLERLMKFAKKYDKDSLFCPTTEGLDGETLKKIAAQKANVPQSNGIESSDNVDNKNASSPACNF